MFREEEKLDGVADFVVLGSTVDGASFALPTGFAMPGDWADHLCNLLSSTGKDRRTVYSAYLRPVAIGDTRAVVIRTDLRHDDPHAYELVRQFVIENKLKVRPGRAHPNSDDEQAADNRRTHERRVEKHNSW